MEKRKKIIVVIILLIIVALIGYAIFNNNENEYKNSLSKNDTFDRFITLIEEGKYEEAKKFTTKNFNANLSSIKDIKISKKQKNYELSNENKFVYIDVFEVGYYKMTTTYYFELQKTNYGWKIDKFYDEVVNNEDELNLLIY